MLPAINEINNHLDSGKYAKILKALVVERVAEERVYRDGVYNIKTGAAYYYILIKKFNDPRKALAAYNGGERIVRKAVRKAGRKGWFVKVKEYKWKRAADEIRDSLYYREITAVVDKLTTKGIENTFHRAEENAKIMEGG